MNLQALRTFLAIIETGSLVRASDMLNVTQSTVTARLHALEDELGQTLLIRNKSGATLTPAGVNLRRYADTIVKLWQQARQETALPDGMSGVCNLACEFDLWPGLGDGFAQALMDQFPDLAISVWLGSQTDVMTWLSEGKSDLALTHRAACPPGHEQISLGTDKLILVSTRRDGPIRNDPSYVLVEAGEAFRRDHAIAYADAAPTRISFGNVTVALAHILQRGGSTYVPKRMVLEELSDARLFHLQDAPIFERPVYMAYNARLKGASMWFAQAMTWLENEIA